MNVLVLGGSGMLGHKFSQVARKSLDVHVTLRQPLASCDEFGIFKDSQVITDVRAEEFDTVIRTVDAARPDVIVNCVGIVKQSAAANDAIAAIKINSLLPHRLAQLARDVNARLIHISTDCVFSGTQGNYTEDDAADADDVYGKTKLLGEVKDERCLTIRTSMIGRELAQTRGLLEWFIAQDGSTVRGFRRAIFSGFTTLALSEILVEIIRGHPELHGVWHVASQPISKFDLLKLLQKTYALDIEIEPDDTFVCDRSLDGSRFEAATGLHARSWPQMIEEMHADATPYEEIRRLNDSRR